MRIDETKGNDEQFTRLFLSGNEFFGILPIDPFKIDNMSADHASGNRNFKLKSSLKNTSVFGLSSKVKVSRVATKFDKKFQMKIEANVELLELRGDYTMEGKILILPILGDGKCNITMKDAKVLAILKGDFVEKDGETFIELTNFTLTLNPKHATFVFTDIFKSDKKISENINQFMNENWKIIFDLLIPTYCEKLSEQFKDYSQKVFSKLPAQNIFLE